MAFSNRLAPKSTKRKEIEAFLGLRVSDQPEEDTLQSA